MYPAVCPVSEGVEMAGDPVPANVVDNAGTTDNLGGPVSGNSG